MPAFTTNATPNTVEALVPANPDRKQVITFSYMAGARVRVDKDRALAPTSANVMMYEDSLVFKGKIARQKLWVISDTASSTINYTEVF